MFASELQFDFFRALHQAANSFRVLANRNVQRCTLTVQRNLHKNFINVHFSLSPSKCIFSSRIQLNEMTLLARLACLPSHPFWNIDTPTEPRKPINDPLRFTRPPERACPKEETNEPIHSPIISPHLFPPLRACMLTAGAAT